MNIDPNIAQRGAADPTASVWVAASAGTGKTKVLTDRMLRLMLAGTEPRRILGLTFTKAAAAEMKLRITGELGAWAAASADDLDRRLRRLLGSVPDDGLAERARRLFAEVLEAPDGINVQTIHAFCQSVLSRFPLEAGVPPGFALIEGREQRTQIATARDRLLRRTGGEGAVADALAALTGRLAERSFAALLEAVVGERRAFAALRGGAGGLTGAIERLRRRFGLSASDTTETVLAAACAGTAFDGPGLRHAADVLLEGGKGDGERSAILRAWLSASPAGRAATIADYTAAFLTGDTGKPGRRPKKLMVNRLQETHPDLLAVLEREAERLIGVEQRLAAVATAEATAALITVGDALLGEYETLKAARGALDFDDLIDRTAALLDGPGGPSWVMYKLDGGIDHLLIDEAQDTSPAQWRVISALVDEFFAAGHTGLRARTVFGVGDFKQSIYSFQGAAPAEFLSARDRFEAAARAAAARFCRIDHSVSFRSTRAVLPAGDALFAQPQAPAGVVDGERPVKHQAWRQRDGGSVELWPLVEKREPDLPAPWAPPAVGADDAPADLRLCALVAARIRAMIADGEPLASAGRPIRPGDIMVLVRSRGRIMEELVRQLKRRDVAVAGVDRMVLTEQLAVVDLTALGRFALLPGDDLNLASVLKGPLIGFDEDQLFRVAHNRPGRLWPALAARADGDPAVAGAVASLREVLALADTCPPFEFFSHILGPMGARRRLLARLGNDAEDPISEFMALALAYERDHPPSLEGFLHWLERTAEETKRDMEQAQPMAVRVMTVHGAKGLQAPIVILPDTTRVGGRKGGGAEMEWTAEPAAGGLPLWSPPGSENRTELATRARDERLRAEAEEANRLLYVAMTRAQDRLIVCGWQTARSEKPQCWYELVRRGLESAPGIERVSDPFLAAAGEATDAAVLRLQCRQEEPPPAARDRTVPAAVPPLPAWATRPAPDERRPVRAAAPSRITGIDLASGRPSATPDQRFRRGLIIHRLLQSLPDLPAADREQRARAWLARPVHRLGAAEQEEIFAAVQRVLAEPSLAPLFAPGSRAEVAIAGLVDGAWVEGRVDRLRIDARSITIVDFKTDRDVPRSAAGVPGRYLRQMAAYRSIVSQIWPARTVRCLLLWTAGPTLMDLAGTVPGRDGAGQAAESDD